MYLSWTDLDIHDDERFLLLRFSIDHRRRIELHLPHLLVIFASSLSGGGEGFGENWLKVVVARSRGENVL